jgi:hypothetical protein
MDYGVLVRERKTVGTRGKPEDFAVCMKSGNSRIYGNEGILINNRATDEVAELDNIRNSFDYWTGNTCPAIACRYTLVVSIKLSRVARDSTMSRFPSTVIPSAGVKMTEAWKRSRNSNAE